MNWLGHVLTALLVPIVFWWLAKLYPAPEIAKEGPSLEELQKKYRWWEVVTLVIMMALWLPVTLGVYEPLHALARWRAEGLREGKETFVFFVDGPALAIPAFFMALLLSGVIMTPLMRFLLKERHAEYERYGALKFRFDAHALTKGLAITVCSGFVLGVVFCFDTYFVASSTELRVNPFFGFERRYAYSDLETVLTAPALKAPNGNTVHRRVTVLRFVDDTSYSLDFLPENEIDGRPPKLLVEALLRRSGLSPTEKAVLESAAPAASAEVPTIDPQLALRDDANDPCQEKAWPTCTARAMILRQSRRKEDKVRAHQRLTRACNAGYLSACSEVGRNLAEGVGVAKDVAAGVALMRKTCNSSLAACNNLGVAYYFGWTGKPDFPEAARLYLRGCGAGEVAGCGNWATMVLDGEIEGDRARALAQLEAACTPSFPIACHALGVFHHLKSGTPEVTKARGYYRLACDAGNADACNNLATIYEAGNGVPQDFAAAAKLYAFACEFGVGTSCRRLSILHAHGAGVPKDYVKARELLTAACDSGEKRACAELGR